jgi:ferritin-like metal-binding protein YciE
MRLETTEDVLIDQIADLQSAEDQLLQALPKMASAASNEDLRQAFQHHLDQTRGHAERLRRISSLIPSGVPAEECKGMKGLIEEGEEIVTAEGTPDAKDAALIAAAQRVEHYEIAAYGTARTLAKELDMDDASDLLEQTLDEEKTADELLNRIATGGLLRQGVNERAAR